VFWHGIHENWQVAGHEAVETSRFSSVPNIMRSFTRYFDRLSVEERRIELAELL